MQRRPPRPTRTATLFPCPTPFRSGRERRHYLRARRRHAAATRHRRGRRGRLAGRSPPADAAEPEQPDRRAPPDARSEAHTSELQSLMRTSYAVFCLKKKRLYHISTRHIEITSTETQTRTTET